MTINKAYLAGVVDSDGSLSFIKCKRANSTKGYHYRMIFQLTWTINEKTKEFMELLKATYTGSFSKCRRIGYKSNQYYVYKYSVEGKGLEKFLVDVTPYLILKKKQAILLMESRDLRNSGQIRGCKKPKHIWDKEDLIYEKFKTLNSKNGSKNL